MELIAILLVAVASVLVAILSRRTPPRPQDSPPPSTQEDDSRASADREAWSEARIAELLLQLDNPYGYWTYANVPIELETEMRRLLEANPANKVAVALQARWPALKRDCATKMVLMRVQDLSDRAELAVTVATKQRNAKEALVTVESAITDGVADPVPLREKVPALRRYVAQVEIDGFTEKAQRFEFKGNLKKALEYYQDALYSAIHDDVDDAEQQEAIQTLTTKVEKLTAALAQVAEDKKTARKKPAPS